MCSPVFLILKKNIYLAAQYRTILKFEYSSKKTKKNIIEYEARK